MKDAAGNQSTSAARTPLTSAIRKIVDGEKVFAVKLRPGDTGIDIGNPESYVRAINNTLELG